MSKKMYGLIPQAFPKNKRWAIDQDYIDGLSPEEKAWLAQFNNEYYGGKVKKGDNTALHNSDSLRKDCYARNNASNRDLYAIKECSNLVQSDENLEIIVELDEEKILSSIESKENWSTFLEYYEKAEK
jgi:hypothetical protein